MNKPICESPRLTANLTVMSEWSESLVSRFSAAMRARRKELDLSVQDVANRTAELGHPLSRSALSSLENNRSGDRLSLPDALVIAECLRVPMLYLLFPEQPDGDVEVVPGRIDTSENAIGIISGNIIPINTGDEIQHNGNSTFAGRGAELETGYELASEVRAFTRFRNDVLSVDLEELRESARGGDKDAEFALREYEYKREIAKTRGVLVRNLGGVVDDSWMNEGKNHNE